MLRKIEGRRRRGRQRMRWHHRLNGRAFKWPLGIGDGQGSLACCSPWALKEWDTTEQLNWTELIWYNKIFAVSKINWYLDYIENPGKSKVWSWEYQLSMERDINLLKGCSKTGDSMKMWSHLVMMKEMQMKRSLVSFRVTEIGKNCLGIYFQGYRKKDTQ